MPNDNEIDPATFDYRVLTLDEINALKSAAIRRAHAERAEALRSFGRRVGVVLRWLSEACGHAWARHQKHRNWRADILALRRMNDCALKDIGLTRLDVEALAYRDRV